MKLPKFSENLKNVSVVFINSCFQNSDTAVCNVVDIKMAAQDRIA